MQSGCYLMQRKRHKTSIDVLKDTRLSLFNWIFFEVKHKACKKGPEREWQAPETQNIRLILTSLTIFIFSKVLFWSIPIWAFSLQTVIKRNMRKRNKRGRIRTQGLIIVFTTSAGERSIFLFLFGKIYALES